MWNNGQRPSLTNTATAQACTQGFELAHLNSYPIYDLLGCVKGLVLWTHSHGITMTRGDSGILMFR